jgi:hypothetical protein
MYKRQRRKDAERSRRINDEKAAETPGFYRHPPPFETNVHWHEDIERGPLPPPSRRTRKVTASEAKQRPSSLRSTHTAESGERAVVVVPPPEAYFGPENVPTRRYKRADDEFIWVDSPAEGGREELSPKTKSKWDYRSWRAPPLNDLHPAVVSVIPANPDDRRWMKLPPPSTEFLNGRKGVTVVERRKESEVIKREKTLRRSAELEERNEENVFLKAPTTTGLERVATPVPRPDSAVSTRPRSKLQAHRRPAPSWGSTSASSSDADDEDEDETLLTRPRAVHLANGITSRPTSKRSVHRPALPTVKSTDSVPTRTPTPSALRDRTNSENISPRTSPRSGITAGSPVSSENESLPSPRLQATRIRTQPLSSRSNSSSQALSHPSPSLLPVTPTKLAKPPTATRSHSHRGERQQDLETQLAELTLSADDLQQDARLKKFLAAEVPSNMASPSRSSDYHMQWDDVETAQERERIWLGARKRMMPIKRWSVDF